MATIDDVMKKLIELEKEQTTTNKSLDEVVTVLKGYNGYPGLCQRHETLYNEHCALRRLVIGLICVLTGTGILTGSTVGILKLVGI